MQRSLLCYLLAQTLALVALCHLPALAAPQAADLAVGEDVPVAGLVVDQVAWLVDERGLVIGGWH
jgi:hypothetical protein